MTAASAADAALPRQPGLSRRLLQRVAGLFNRGAARCRTPSVLQMEALECGAASLAIVLAHYGRRVPLEELRVACGVSRDGSKASNVLKAARRYGLVAKGFRREVAELAELPVPSIIHWNFNHFLVFEGFGREHAFLNDPGEGRRTVTLDEFGECFTGVVLAFERASDFTAGGKAPSLAKALSAYLRNTRTAILFLLVASIAIFVPGVVIPAFTRIFVDDVLIGQFTEWLPPLLIGMACAAMLRAALVWLQQSCLIRLEQRLAIGMGAKLLWHVLRLPPRFFDQRFVGDVADRIAASERIARLLSGQLATNLLGIVALVFYAAVMAVYDPLLTAIGVGIGLLNFLALSGFARRRGALNRGLLIDHGKLLGTSVDIIRSVESIKTAGLEQASFARWAGYHSKVLSGQQALAVFDGISSVLPALLAALSTATILGIGGWRVMDGAMTVGTLVAFQSLMASFAAPIARLVELAGHLQQIKADLERTDDVMRFPRDPRYDQKPHAFETEPARLSGAVTLAGVSFGFSPFEPPLIEDFSLSLTPGMRVALVGASGSGKSTLGRIIAGLYQPIAGEVRFDGIPVMTVPRALFASSVAYVDQDIFLFEGTVRDNLTLWDATIPEEDLVTALKDAVIHEEVATRAGRYDCPVAEGGSNFSGGQRQRLEIARALVGSPSILVLDEATAALDPITEQQIDENFRRRGCTCVIIAHRLSTIRDCDEIIVLDKGKVVARGRHEELLAEGGFYARLIQSE
jgi:NHLM bacteriocin system ABC transporter peptidase/ATP-binding protein